MKNTIIIILAAMILLIVFLLGIELSGHLSETLDSWLSNFDRLTTF